MRLRFLNIVATVDLCVPLHLKHLCLHLRHAEFNPTRFRAVIFRLREPLSTCLIFSTGKLVVTGCESIEHAKLAALKYARIIERAENLERKREEMKGEEISTSAESEEIAGNAGRTGRERERGRGRNDGNSNADPSSFSSSSSNSTAPIPIPIPIPIPLPVRVEFRGFHIQNLVGVTDVRFAIRLELLYECCSRVKMSGSVASMDASNSLSDENESEKRARIHLAATPQIKELFLTTAKGSAVFEPDLFPGLIYRLEEPKCVILIFVNGKLVITGAKSQSNVETAAETILQLLWYFKKID